MLELRPSCECCDVDLPPESTEAMIGTSECTWCARCVKLCPEGGYLHAQNWRRSVRWTTTGLGRRPHDLRHTAASLWIAAGVDIKTVSAWLGHSTAKLTLDTYGHLMGTDADRAALDRVNRVLGSRTVPAEPEEQDEPGEGESGNGR